MMSSQEGDNMATDNAVEDNSGSSTAAAVANSNSNSTNDIATTNNNNSNNEQPPSANNNNNNNNNNTPEEEEKRKKKEDEASQKRRAIQSIMKDTTLTDLERRFRIQNLMDGSSSKKQNGGKVGRDGSIGMGREELLRGGICRSTAVTASLRNLGTSLLGSAASGGDVNSSAAAAGNTNQEQQNTGVTPCIHYERKCNIISPCCQRIFGCRICHDDVMNLHGGGTIGVVGGGNGVGGEGSGEESKECGPMDRFGIKEIVCKECNVLQDSKTNKCINCGIKFAEYHCPKCNIWMALGKRPFHCEECGFCRVGGEENFKHCSECSMCIAVSTFDTHNCMKDKYRNNCPVCREDMFSSRQSPQDLPCGHAIHAHCFRNLAGFDYRCPICKKTVVSQESMSAAWTARARDIEMQPMPDDLKRVVNIMCNDCEKKSENCNWHFLGVQCRECGSFNTIVENVVSSGQTTASSTAGGGN